MTTITTLTVGALGTNCYLIDDGTTCAVIDPGDEAPRILEAIESRGLTCGALLLTHGHFDHTGALAQLKAATGAPLTMHEGDAGSSPVPPDVLCRDGDTLAVGSMTITVIETPGHTPGCVCYLVDGTLFSGDTLFRDSVGRTDLAGGSYPVLRGSLIKLRDLPYDDLRVLPGHMEETTLRYERANNPFIEKGNAR